MIPLSDPIIFSHVVLGWNMHVYIPSFLEMMCILNGIILSFQSSEAVVLQTRRLLDCSQVNIVSEKNVAGSE